MSAPDPTRRERVARAVGLKKSRDLAAAVQALEGLVAEDREDTYALGHLAHAMLLRRQPREALALADQVLARESRNGFVHSVRGEALLALKRWQEAAEDLEAALAGGWRSAFIHSRLAQARAKCGDPDGARRALERGIAEFPDDAKLLLALGRHEKATGDPAGARHVEEAARRLPGDAFAYKELIAQQMGSGDDAVSELRRLLKVPSQARNPHLQSELARQLTQRKDHAGAAAAARRAHELEPANRRYRAGLAYALARAGDDAAAAALFQACLDDEPEDHLLNKNYIAARRRLGQLDEAHAFYLQLLRRHPEAKKVFGYLRKVARTAESDEE